MAVTVPRMQTFDYGRAIQTGQQISYNRMRNEAVGMELKQQKSILANRQKAQLIREHFAGMPAQIEELEAQGLFDEAGQLRNSYIDAKFNEVKVLETMRLGINAENYKQFRSDLLQAGAVTPEMMPTEYSDKWFSDALKKNKGNLQQLTRQWGQEGVIMEQDYIAQDGEIQWIGQEFEAAKQPGDGGGDGKPFQMKAADTNSIRAATRELYGSMWDPTTGRYSGLNKKQEQEVLAIQSEASRIYRANKGRVGHSEVVVRAARKLDIEIRDLHKYFGDLEVLKGIDFHVDEG